MKYVQVAIPLPVQDPFSYEMNGDADRAQIGSRVIVPFKNREIQGYIVGFEEKPAVRKMKAVKALIDEQSLFDARFLGLTRWMSEYYFSSWGEAIENALPKAVKLGKKDWISQEQKMDVSAPPTEWKLTDEQDSALETIHQTLKQDTFQTILLHGVTGSGKSEIYIRAIKKTLELGKEAICLVPEIALTTQIRDFFCGHFPGILELIHSRLTDRERMLAWIRVREGKSRVVLGPRSALFAPVKKLGLIILDEEHENSYKQAENPRYHAREVARKRAELEGAVLLMGSATPSLETMLQAEEGKILKLVLKKRVVNRQLPEVRIVDLKREMENHRKLLMFSFPLQNEVRATLERKEACLLLLNRRGFATQVQCLACGKIIQCRHCQVSLTFHQSKKILLCHYCNYESGLPEKCPDCATDALKYVGWGTEKIESEIARLFPQARVSRLDTDVARKKGMHEKIIQEFRDGKIDILVGTQMIAKGFDFPRVTTVGVISADVGLALPDFRAGERTFQLLTQVAGRAGRGEKIGRVFVQTFSPEHHSVRFAKNHDYDSFYRNEIAKRSELNLPPFIHLINIILHEAKEQEVYKYALELKAKLKEKQDEHFEVIGPAPLPFYFLRGHYRWHLMLKVQDVLGMSRILREIFQGFRRPAKLKIIVDIDPVSIL